MENKLFLTLQFPVHTDAVAQSAAGDETQHNQEVYANVLFWRTKDCGKAVEETSQEEDVQYASVTFHRSFPPKK